MKSCELCGLRARIYCESDQASLCWDCEEKVHGANFLVAKHTRNLLCHVCQLPTPWKASGPKLSPTVTVCENCVDYNSRECEAGRGDHDESQGGNDDGGGDDDDEVDTFLSDDEDGEDFGEEDDEDGENQVVPWSSSSSSHPPPPVASSSSSEEEGFSATKRMRQNADLDSDDEIGGGCSFANDDATSSHLFRPLKRPRITEAFQSGRRESQGQEESRSTAIIHSLQRLQNDVVTDDDHASAAILGICKLCRDQSS